MKEDMPRFTVVAYINTTAELKTVCDVCVTSSSAVKIIRSIPNDKILFIPDCNLGDWISKQVPEKKFELVRGGCPTHLRMTKLDVERARKQRLKPKFLCIPNVIRVLSPWQILWAVPPKLCPMQKKVQTANTLSARKTVLWSIYSSNVPIKAFFLFRRTAYVIICRQRR